MKKLGTLFLGLALLGGSVWAQPSSGGGGAVTLTKMNTAALPGTLTAGNLTTTNNSTVGNALLITNGGASGGLPGGVGIASGATNFLDFLVPNSFGNFRWFINGGLPMVLTGNNLNLGPNLSLATTNTVPTTANGVGGSTNGLHLNSVTGNSTYLDINGVNVANVSASAVTLGAGVNLQMGSGAINLGNTGTATVANNQIFGGSFGVQINAPTGKQAYVQCNGATGFVAGSANGSINDAYWGIGSWGAANAGNAAKAGIYWGGGGMAFNVPSANSYVYYCNSLPIASWTPMITTGGVLQTYPIIALANSATTNLFTINGRYGRVYIFDNTGQYCYVRLGAAATPVIESGSANFEVGAAPTALQYQIVITTNVLQIVVGSGAATSATFIYEGI